MNSWFVKYPVRRRPKLRIFCFPPAGCSASEFRHWGHYFPEEIEIVGLQLPGRENRFSDSLIKDFSCLIDILCDELEKLVDIPYIIFGHSLGALIGYEIIKKRKIKSVSLPKLFITSAMEAPHCLTLPHKIQINNDDEVIDYLRSYDAIPHEFLNSIDFKKTILPYIKSDFLTSMLILAI